MSREGVTYRLTAKGWQAANEGSIATDGPAMLQCPGDGERGCLARTPGGRQCYFCRPRYGLHTTEPTLRSTQPLADMGGGSDAG